MRRSKTYYYLNDGSQVQKDDESFWTSLYAQYQAGKTILDLERETGVPRKTVTEGFKSRSLPIRAIRDVRRQNAMKTKEILQVKYGCDNPGQTVAYRAELWKQKDAQYRSQLAAYGYDLLTPYQGLREPSLSLPNGRSFQQYDVLHRVCGTVFKDDLFEMPRCLVCYDNKLQSQPEVFYCNYIKSLLPAEVVQTNRRDLVRSINHRFYDIDIYLPARKVAFEHDGIYYHSTGHVPKNHNKAKDKYYHQQKSAAALKAGILLYHIWGHYPQTKVQSAIKSALGLLTKKIYARNLSIQMAPKRSLVRKFFEQNHIHGSAKGFLSGALLDGDSPLAVLTFRQTKNPAIAEIARFATILNVSIPGGFSRLLKYSLPLLKARGYKTIHTKADRDWSPDPYQTVYHKCGFAFLGDSGPSMSYTDFNKVYPRQKFQKHKLPALFPESFVGLTEDEIALIPAQTILAEYKIYPLYTSGNWKYELTLD